VAFDQLTSRLAKLRTSICTKVTQERGFDYMTPHLATNFPISVMFLGGLTGWLARLGGQDSIRYGIPMIALEWRSSKISRSRGMAVRRDGFFTSEIISDDLNILYLLSTYCVYY